jgi:hypothetical protein
MAVVTLESKAVLNDVRLRNAYSRSLRKYCAAEAGFVGECRRYFAHCICSSIRDQQCDQTHLFDSWNLLGSPYARNI